MESSNLVIHPEDLRDNLAKSLAGLQELTRLIGELGADPEQPLLHAWSRQPRPLDHTQALLDMVRSVYETRVPFGSLSLNGNPDLLLAGLPDQPFNLEVVSVTSNGEQGLGEFWGGGVLPYIERLGLEPQLAIGGLGFLGGSLDRMLADPFGYVEGFASLLGAGLSPDDAENLMKAGIEGGRGGSEPSWQVGFYTDDALGPRLRISLWLFFEPPG